MSSFDSARSTSEDGEVSIVVSRNPICEAISDILERVIATNKLSPSYQEKVISQSHMVFSSWTEPKITLSDYLERITFYSKCEENTVILSLIFIDKLVNLSSLVITSFNVHRLVFTSLLVAIKFNEDKIYDMNYFSAVSGMEKNELIKCEHEFLMKIKFELYVDEKKFFLYRNNLMSKIQKCKDN